MEKKIVIFGSGGFGREVLQLIRDINKSQPTWVCAGFIVDKGYVSATLVHDLPVLGDIQWLKENPDVAVVVAIGSSVARRRIANNIENYCDNYFATLIHPHACIGESVDVGAGVVVCAGAVITTDIKICDHVHINMSSTIGHDVVLENYVTLSPGVNVSGNVMLKEGVEVGTGSVIIPHCTVGEWSIVGAGSVVTSQIKENSTAVGTPAQVIKERSSGWQDS